MIESGMAIDHLHLDQPEEAFSCLRAVVPRIDLHDDLGLFSEVAEVLAFVSADRGEQMVATKLLGAGAAIRLLSGLSASELYELDTLQRELSTALPRAEFERELALWSTCSLDEAHELVMGALFPGSD